MNSGYMKALKSKPMKDVHMSVSENKQATLDQKGKCIQCNKPLKPYLHKFMKNPATKKMEAICADCYVKIKRR